MTSSDEILIRAVREQDVPLIRTWLPQGGAVKHDIRWRRQSAGEVLYLVAWSGDVPVGHILLKWRGTEDERIARAVILCPDLEDLLVHPTWRSRGVGRALLRRAEREVCRRGFRQVGLGVGVDNSRARALYERVGYQPAPVAEYSVGGEFVDEHQRIVHWNETCIYLVKRLDDGLKPSPTSTGTTEVSGEGDTSQ